MRHTRPVVVFPLVAFACAAALAALGQAQAPAPTVYDGARLIVGDGSTPIENGAFVVENGRITQIGPRASVKAPAGAARVDLAGKTVMPAIVDAHTHIASEPDVMMQQLRHKAYYGVAALISLGQDAGERPFEIRGQVVPNAPRFLTAGRGITSPEPGRSEVPYWVTTEEEIRAAVRELAARKVDLVKLWVDDREGKYKKLSPALYGAAIAEAHKHGLRVTAHIFALEDAKGLLRAGIDAFAHGVRDRDVDDEFLALLKQRPNVVLVPNLPERGVKVDLGWLAETVPAAELARLQAAATERPTLQQAFAIQARNLVQMQKAGVRIAFGTDGSVPWAHHLEMEDMVAAGLTPAQVIAAATRTSAEFLRLPDLGSLAVGKSADFLVLDANPLDAVTNTRRIGAVYLRGAAVDRAGFRANRAAQ